MKKLLLVTDTYHPKVDGTVRFIEEFIHSAKESYDITVLAPKFGPHKHESGVREILLNCSRWLVPLPEYPSVGVSVRNFFRIAREIKKADLVFVQGPALMSLLATLFAHLYKKKVVYFTHVLSWELLAKSREGWFTQVVARAVRKASVISYNWCNRIFVPYPRLVQKLSELGVKTEMRVTNLGVDINVFTPAENKKEAKRQVGIDEDALVIGYIGRISPEKNVNILSEAYVKPTLRDVKKHLLIVGDGGEEQKKPFEMLLDCTITGFTADVAKYAKAMDVFVMPSFTETTSLATLEAMASGVSVIAAPVGYVKDYVVRGKNGLFFPRNSASVLALKIKQLYTDEELRETLGVEGRKTVIESFSWKNCIRRMLDELRDLQ